MFKGKDVQLTISDFCPKFSEGQVAVPKKAETEEGPRPGPILSQNGFTRPLPLMH